MWSSCQQKGEGAIDCEVLDDSMSCSGVGLRYPGANIQELF